MHDHDYGLEPGHHGRGPYGAQAPADQRSGRSLVRAPHPPQSWRRGGATDPSPLPLPLLDNDEKRRFSLGDYLGLIWRGKWIILASMIVAGTIAAYYTYSRPFVYQSSLQVLINERDKSADVFATRGDGMWIPPERILKKELQILSSQPVRERAAEVLVGRRWLDSARRDSLIPIVATAETSLGGRRRRMSAEQIREALINEVAARLPGTLQFNPSKEADVIKIYARSGDPTEAALIANTYAEAYQEDNQIQNRASARKLKEFVADRLSSTRDSLSKQEQLLRSYRDQNGIVGVAEQAADLLSTESKLRDEAAAARVEISALGRRLQESRRQLGLLDAALPDQIASAFPSTIASAVTEKAKLETKRKLIQAGRQQYASQQWYDSQMKGLDDAIAALESKIHDESDRYRRSQSGMAAAGDGTTALRSLRQQIIDDQIGLETARARLGELSAAAGAIKSRLSQVPTQEMDMQRLERDRGTLERLYTQLNERYYQSVLEEQSVFSNVRILETAHDSKSPISPNRTQDIITGVIGGLALGVGVVLLIAFIDTTIHTPDDLEKAGFTMLTAIPTIREEMLDELGDAGLTSNGRISPHLITQADPKSPIAESYRSLRTSLQFAAIDESTSVILFTSSTPQEGKSTTSVNSATVFAQTGARTLLIDCDLRRPILHSIFGLAKEPGLVNCLVGKVPLDEAIFSSRVPNLDILTSGSIPPNPSELLGSRRMRDLIEELRERYDIIVIDSPPTSAVTDAAILSTMSDMSVLVVRAHRTKIEFLEKTRAELQRVFVSPLGVVLNDFDVSQSYGSAYRYYRYYKYYGYYGQTPEQENRKKRRAMAALRG